MWDDGPGPGRAALPPGVDGVLMATGPGLALLLAAPAGEHSELVWAGGDRTERPGLTLVPPKDDAHAGPGRVFSCWTDDASWLVDTVTGHHLVLDREVALVERRRRVLEVLPLPIAGDAPLDVHWTAWWVTCHRRTGVISGTR